MREADGELRELPVGSIDANRFQPREHFDEESLVALAESIRVLGVLQPVLVRPAEDERYELIAGERRWRAARRAGLTTIPAIIRDVNDTVSLEQALVENLHRDDLNPLEEAAAYQQLVEDFRLTQEEVASRVGRSRSAVANTLRLLHLPPTIQRLVGERRLSAGHARALLGTPDRAFQEGLAQRIVSESLSVRETEEAVRRRGELARSLRPLTDPATGGDGSGVEDEHPELGVPDDLVREQDDADRGPASTSGREPRRASAESAKPGTEGEDENTNAQPLSAVVEAPPALLELESLLGEYLDTTVTVSLTRQRGKVVVEFADLEDLERIYLLIAGS